MFNNNNNNKETTMQKTNLKHENVANVGDKIRANDFMPREGRNACYIEGTVIEKGTCDDKYYSCYKISLTKKIFDGKDLTDKVKDKIWYVPFEIDFDEHDTRIQKL